MRMTRRIAPLIALAALGSPALARAAAPVEDARLVRAFRSNDVTTLASWARSATTTGQRALAEGALDALRRQDAKAIAMLLPVSRAPGDSTLRATALLALANVYLRDGRYRDCYDAIRTAAHLSPRSVHRGDAQNMGFAHALMAVKPMRVVRNVPGSVPIVRDRAGLMRIAVTLDAHPEQAVLDTGAQFSTVSASTARQIGLRMVRQMARVSSSTERSVPTRLGVARRLQLGHTVLANVVFIVLPDSALRFAHGAYSINAIVGLPVLLALRRTAFVHPRGAARLVFGARQHPAPPRPGAPAPDLLLSSLAPLVLVRLPGVQAPLRMLLDTGANATLFAHNVVQADPQLLQHAATRRLRLGGAGGTKTDPHALRLPEVTLFIGTERFVLQHVAVRSGDHKSADGTLGEDVLRQGDRVILNFRTMQMRILKP